MKTGRTVLNLCKTFDFCKTFDIHKILLPLDGRSRIYRVSKACKDKASRPVLDVEEVTILLSINAKGLKILFSKELYICLIKED